MYTLLSLYVYSEFKTSLDLQASEVYHNVETAVYSMYDQSSSMIQEKLQELMQVLQRIGEI